MMDKPPRLRTARMAFSFLTLMANAEGALVQTVIDISKSIGSMAGLLSLCQKDDSGYEEMARFIMALPDEMRQPASQNAIVASVQAKKEGALRASFGLTTNLIRA